MTVAAPANRGTYWPMSALGTAGWLSPLPFPDGGTEPGEGRRLPRVPSGPSRAGI